MKRLVTATTIEEFLRQNKDVFPVTKDTLVTPSAVDLAREKGIEFVMEDSIEASPADAAPALTPEVASDLASSDFTKEQLVEAVIKALDSKGILAKILNK